MTPNPLENQPGAGRQGDAIVDEVVHEFKTLEPGADSSRIKNVVNNSIRGTGQGRNIVIDARASGLTAEEANAGIARAFGIARGKLDSISIIGDNYFIQTFRKPMTPPLSIFINTQLPLTASKNALTTILRCRPFTSEPDVGTIHTFDTFGISWALFDSHGLEDDRQLKFTQYEHELDLLPLKKMSGSKEYERFYNAAAHLVASETSLSLACDVLLVANLATHVATYIGGSRVRKFSKQPRT